MKLKALLSDHEEEWECAVYTAFCFQVNELNLNLNTLNCYIHITITAPN